MRNRMTTADVVRAAAGTVADRKVLTPVSIGDIPRAADVARRCLFWMAEASRTSTNERVALWRSPEDERAINDCTGSRALRTCAGAPRGRSPRRRIRARRPIDPAFVRAFQRSTVTRPVPTAFLDAVTVDSEKLPARIWRAALQDLLDAGAPTAAARSLHPPSPSRATATTRPAHDLRARRRDPHARNDRLSLPSPSLASGPRQRRPDRTAGGVR